MAAATRPNPVPSGPYTEDRFGYRHPLVVETPAGEVFVPEGNPTDAWTNAQLDAYAGREGIDVSGAKNKAARLTAIDAHREALLPALPPAE
ncbi:hypothetical protein [Microbacterium proteolyticum]|uniref:hypothetical protein n=1 Tax=Microbacterium proteolyticum TaxID=1572644 RepID=UPI0035BF2E84